MARTRCWRCYALMAEEHKGLFEAVTLILAARGSCGSATLKPLLAICWGHQKQVNQHLHQHRKGNQTAAAHDAHAWPTFTRIENKRSRSKAKCALKEAPHFN